MYLRSLLEVSPRSTFFGSYSACEITSINFVCLDVGHALTQLYPICTKKGFRVRYLDNILEKVTISWKQVGMCLSLRSLVQLMNARRSRQALAHAIRVQGFWVLGSGLGFKITSERLIVGSNMPKVHKNQAGQSLNSTNCKAGTLNPSMVNSLNF